jgi:hypothetical protein
MTISASKLRFVSTAFVILIGLSGCVESETPLSDPKTSKVDKRLSGVWRGTKESGQTIVMVCGPSDIKGHPAGMMRLEWFEIDDVTKTFVKRRESFFTSDVGDSSFMNVIGDWGRIKPLIGEPRPLNFQLQGEYESILSSEFKKALVPSYSFFRYEIKRDRDSEKDTLTTWDTSEDTAREAIKSGAIKGTVDEPGSDHPIFKDSSENLARFFQSDLGKKLFSSGKKQTLIRLK